jgi:hypothetical protein
MGGFAMSSIDRRGFLAGADATATLALIEPAVSLAQPMRGHIDPLGHFGSLLNRQEFDQAPHVLDPNILALFQSQSALRGIVKVGPAKRHVLTGLPPIFMQGTAKSLGYPGSCEACSFGYGLGTYAAARGFNGFDPLPRTNHVSVAWLFSWAQRTQSKTGCGGSLALPYLGLLVSNGAPSAVQVPYKPSCPYIAGISTTTDTYPGIGKFKIGSYKALPNFLNGQSTYLKWFKQYLNADHAIAFSGLVANGYDNPATAMFNGAFAPTGFITGSGHGQMIVGYDDSLGHTGAFLVQNSFGVDWPYMGATTPLMKGRLWSTYESFFASQGFGAVAYPIPRPVIFPRTVILNSPTPQAPVARILEAVRANLNGESFVALEINFDQPVKLNAVRVTPLRAQSPVVAAYNAPIKYGYARVIRRAPFPAGRYAVELDAHTLSSDLAEQQPLTYRGFVTIS